MVPILKNWELLVENEDWSLLKAKVLAHLENCLRSSPFELYGHNNKFCEAYLLSGKFSNLYKILKTQKGKLIIGQKPKNAMPFQMVPSIVGYSEFRH